MLAPVGLVCGMGYTSRVLGACPANGAVVVSASFGDSSVAKPEMM